MSRSSGVYLVSARRTEPYIYDNEGGDTSMAMDDMNGPEVYEEEEESPFYGMNKEELLEISSSTCWRRFRTACVAFVLLSWLALLVAVVVLVLMYPKCKAPEERSWWQNDVIYRIYVRSFKDSDGDGVGDLQGVEQELDYIRGLGANTISLSPVFQTDGTDSDFGVTDSLMVHADLGSMDDLTSLISKVKDRGMRILLDFIPNQTSRDHAWFVDSAASSARSNTFRNYYVWSGSTNNWRMVDGDGAWTLSETRNQSYLHQIAATQPDLNLRSGQVQDKLKAILEFWLSKGVNGFYVRNSAFLFEDYDLRDEVSNGAGSTNAYDNLDHEYTFGLPGVYDMLWRWRTVVGNSSDSIIMADMPSTDIKEVMSYYGSSGRDGAQLSLNTHFFDKTGSCNGACVGTYVESWMSNLPSGRWANWMAGDENVERFASRFTENYIRAYYMITMLLPGTPILYYGDEIMLKNVTSAGVSGAMRTLMQWTNATHGGFCSAANCSSPWIPSNAESVTNNVQSQTANQDSLLNYIKKLTQFRKATTFRVGNFHLALVDNDIVSFVMEFNGENGYLVAVNFGATSQTRSFYGRYTNVEKEAEVAMTSGPDVGLVVEDKVMTDSITLGPLQGVVVTWDFVANEEL